MTTMTREQFDSQMVRFVAAAQALSDNHYVQYEGRVQAPKIVTGEGGKRFVRVVKQESTSRSVYCFVEIATGDVYKAASWKTPAKGVRGNITEDHGDSCTAYGAKYFR